MSASAPAESSKSVSAQFAGDAELRNLYEAHGSVLLSYLMRLTRGDRQRAEDLLQETLMRAWRHPEAQSASGEWSRAWLVTVARRVAIDHLRAALVRPSEIGEEHLGSVPVHEDAVDRFIDRHEVHAAVAALPSRLREVLVEVYLKDRTVAEAAAILRVPAGTVKSRSFYGLRALREELQRRGFHPTPPNF
jgi:RNA polymerase sigma-70 factor (ECF subfamily)